MSGAGRMSTSTRRRRTRLLGGLAGASIVALFGAEGARIRRLGLLPVGRGEDDCVADIRGRLLRAVRIAREGYGVSRTRENALFNMLASSVLAFTSARCITWLIRERGGLGPIRNVTVGDRHIHHFLPGGLLVLITGGVAITVQSQLLDRWLAIPYGVGGALVLDEAALLLELDDVYWTEEGVLSVQIAFAAMGLLAATAYAIQVLRQGEQRRAETDWELAARAWDDLQDFAAADLAEPGGALSR
jgi:hypothetical protein